MAAGSYRLTCCNIGAAVTRAFLFLFLLFGAVTAKEIAEAVKKELGVDVDKRKIVLDADIKACGVYEVEVKLLAGVTAKMKVSITEE